MGLWVVWGCVAGLWGCGDVGLVGLAVGLWGLLWCCVGLWGFGGCCGAVYPKWFRPVGLWGCGLCGGSILHASGASSCIPHGKEHGFKLFALYRRPGSSLAQVVLPKQCCRQNRDVFVSMLEDA